jgi:transcriptional regulator with XRE-family HTH domain
LSRKARRLFSLAILEINWADSGPGLFGKFVLRAREAKDIGLREMAEMIGVSPTYLSKVERDEFAPPTEDKVKAIAHIIGCDVDELLARAGRVASDLSDIIKRHRWNWRRCFGPQRD